jgi:hypothetical protein
MGSPVQHGLFSWQRGPGGWNAAYSRIEAVLESLKSLVLRGCALTAIALHCHRHPAMAQAVLAARGH